MATLVKELLAAADAVVPRIGRAEAEAPIAGGDVLVVDVRDAPEPQAAGEIQGAKHVSRGMGESKADPALPYHDPAFAADRTVLLYCASGGRSAPAGKGLQDLGYKDLRNGAVERVWSESWVSREGYVREIVGTRSR